MSLNSEFILINSLSLPKNICSFVSYSFIFANLIIFCHIKQMGDIALNVFLVICLRGLLDDSDLAILSFNGSFIGFKHIIWRWSHIFLRQFCKFLVTGCLIACRFRRRLIFLLVLVHALKSRNAQDRRQDWYLIGYLSLAQAAHIPRRLEPLRKAERIPPR